jgi:membrane-associated protease RseP (regulator of RpoE activity)
MFRVNILLVFLICLVSGCAGNPYTQYYAKSQANEAGLIPSTGEPHLFRGTTVAADNEAMEEDGYTRIGQSAFNTSGATIEDGLAQAKAVGAAAIVVYIKYTGTISGMTPLILPSSQTSTTTLNGLVGTTSVYGTARTTTSGTTTTYIPYSEDRWDYVATYWKKTKPGVLGVAFRQMTADERREAGSNRGVMVAAVRKDSPAFLADFFKGDVIVRVGEVEAEPESFKETLAQYAGQQVNIVLIRDGKQLVKKVQLREVTP